MVIVIATVKQKLSDIEKALIKSQKNNKQLINECDKKINEYIENLATIPDLSEKRKQEYLLKIKEFQDFKKELENKDTYEEQKRELQAIKFEEQLKKQDLKMLQEHFFKEIDKYFIDFPNLKNEIANKLELSEIIKDEIKYATDIYGDMFDFNDYLYAYKQAKKDVLELYKGDILEEKNTLKSRQERSKNKKKKRTATLLGIIALGEMIKPRSWK